MLRAIPHAVVASLAIFTLSDGPVEKAEAPAPGAGQAVKPARAAPPPRQVEPEQGRGVVKATSPSQGRSNKSQGQAAKAPAQGSSKAPSQGSAGERTQAVPAKAAASAVHADAKPCEPVKPCSID